MKLSEALINPAIYLADPWDKEILKSQKGVSMTTEDLKSFTARWAEYFFVYRQQEYIALLWCFKHEWGLKIPELRYRIFKKFESRGILLQKRLQLCIQCHPYYSRCFGDTNYRDAGHWFEEIRIDINQVNANHIFSQPEQDRGNKKADTKRHRETLNALKCGENPCDETNTPHLWKLIEIGLNFGNKGSRQQMQSISNAWTAYLKAYSAYITDKDRSTDHGDFFISNGNLMMHKGKGNAAKPVLADWLKEQQNIFFKNIDADYVRAEQIQRELFETHTQ